MLSLLDIAERIQKGPKMEENAWNMALFKKMNQLTEDYSLKYPGGDAFFNTDESEDRSRRANESQRRSRR